MVSYYRRNFRRQPKANKKTYGSNVPVRKAITKYRKYDGTKPVGQKVENNRNAIMTLSRQVKSLQLAKIGPYQTRAETFLIHPTNMGTSVGAFDNTHPLCFCLNQFVGGLDSNGQSQRAPIYYTDTTGHGQKLAWRWAPWLPSGFAASPDVNPHWGSQDDAVSIEQYKPLGTKVKFEIRYNSVASGSMTKWIRIDIVKPKKMLKNSALHALHLPYGLGQFTKLAADGITGRNFINTQYWDVTTKWIPFINNSGVTKTVNKVITITRSYKNSPPIVCDLNATPAHSAYGYPDFDLSVDPRQLEWCVISCSAQPDQVNMLRNTSWRDAHGVAA